MSAAARIAQALAGRRVKAHGGNYLVPCPAHDDANPSLSIRDGERGLVVHCFAGCDSGDVLAALRERGLLPPKSPWREPLDIWRDAIDAHGTPVERYLMRRGIALPPGAEALRYHPACPFAGEKTPVMVALVRGIDSNVPQAIHRTALDRSGNKITIDGKDRMALGPIAGGAVKLTSDENVTIALGIAEGIETALSLRALPEWAGSPVWSMISASGIGKFPLLGGIETLAISADHDAAGEKATIEVAERWAEREVLIFEAQTDGTDLNDIVREAAS
jgi:putative DNA primase/helicase